MPVSLSAWCRAVCVSVLRSPDHQEVLPHAASQLQLQCTAHTLCLTAYSKPASCIRIPAPTHLEAAKEYDLEGKQHVAYRGDRPLYLMPRYAHDCALHCPDPQEGI
jgi:hypothetical protein